MDDTTGSPEQAGPGPSWNPPPAAPPPSPGWGPPPGASSPPPGWGPPPGAAPPPPGWGPPPGAAPPPPAWGPPPAGQAPPASPEVQATVSELSWPLHRARGWLQLMAVVSILSGVVSALSIVGLVVAWLPIWAGVLLFRTTEKVEQARERGDRAAFVAGLDQLRTYFVLQGVLMLVSLIVTAIAMVVMLTMGMAGMTGLLKELS